MGRATMKITMGPNVQKKCPTMQYWSSVHLHQIDCIRPQTRKTRRREQKTFVERSISSLPWQRDSLQVRRARPQGSNTTGYQDDAVEPCDNVGHPEPPVVTGSQHSQAKQMNSVVGPTHATLPLTSSHQA